MAIPPIAPNPGEAGSPHAVGKTRTILLVALSALLVLCLVFLWTTRGAMENLSFLRQQGGSAGPPSAKKTLVDVSIWQTAQALAAVAVTAEETEFARDAERLADHEVDQAFASALRQARLRAEHRTLSGEAAALAQKVAQLQQLIAQDQSLVKSLTPASNAPANASKSDAPDDGATGDDLDVAKAQLGLDTDELADAQEDLARASGDDSAQIQQELAAHEASMRAYDNASQATAQIASISEKQHGTLAGRVRAWFSQLDRYKSIQQAEQKAQQDAAALTSQHNALESQTNAAGAASANGASDHASKLAGLKDRSAERQILSIYDDRIQTNKQLATVYGKWANQVLVQHSIVLHLILRSLALIVFILICMVVCDALVRKLMSRPSLDRKQTQTLRNILVLGIQVVGAVLILLVIFGTPEQTPTILGLVTAALTVALQDFIVAFLGWFVLVGKSGIHVGDWVEINGVGGEVTNVGLFRTSLLETGTLEDKGHPTGRRTTFMNSFAIRGQFFNFSTSGQWMWDEISVTLPASEELTNMVERIHQVVLEETQENAHLAETEWKRIAHGIGMSRFSAEPVVNLRPSSSGIGIQVRYVTRASERFELRNRLYERVVELLRQPGKPDAPEGKVTVGTV
ncbi:MAG TPA: mechanosensitive ion channel domain-containing protein [Terracidiphilus sp.]|jgi:small-conductance mechanosensitive channel|nr:mechanosensitive ion channel domain-containing protein [Terracidiphilus sp.]